MTVRHEPAKTPRRIGTGTVADDGASPDSILRLRGARPPAGRAKLAATLVVAAYRRLQQKSPE